MRISSNPNWVQISFWNQLNKAKLSDVGTTKKQWMIKDESGVLTGPYTTQQILERIRSGEYLGDELISSYPISRWYPISQEPEFYDHLLEALSTPEDVDATLPPDPTMVRPKTQPKASAPKQEEDPTLPPLKSETIVEPPKKKKKKRKRSRHIEDLELVDTRDHRRKAYWLAAWKPIAAAAVILAAGVYLLFSDEDQREERIHLIAPAANRPQIPQDQLKEKTQKSVGEFTQDTFAGYMRAQNELVQVIEGAPKYGEAMALLCLTYFELWPFAYQDSQDYRAISRVTQAAAAADPTGLHAATCKAVDLMLKGRYGEARNLTATVFETYPETSEQPPILFFYIQALLLEASQELNTALGYLSTAQQLWPQWTKAFAHQAHLYARLEQPIDAAKVYRQVLTMNPNHNVAKIELGILEYKYFRNLEKGEQFIRAGVADSRGVTRRTLSRGHLGLAEIFLQKNAASEALNEAQKAYSLDSTNATAKNLAVQLGGSSALKKTRFKSYQLIAEGDQFFREGDFNAAQAHFKAAYEADRKNAVAAMKAATSLWRLSLSTEAIDWLTKAIQSDPKLIEAYVLLADYHTQRFNFLAAAQVLASAQRVAPKSHEVFRGFAMVELRRNNPKDAVNFAKQALAIYETDVESQVIMAEALLKLRDFRQAFSHATKAVEIDVNNRRAQIVYGQALAGVQGVESGLAFLKQLVSNYPVVGEYRLALGKLLLDEESHTQAEEAFRQLTRIEEQNKDAFLYLGKALQAQSRFEEALDAFLKAAILDPADAEPLFMAGTLYLEINKPEDARVQFQRVLRINKLYPLVHYNLGRAALMLNNPQEALNEAKEERKVNPNLADAYLLAADAYTAMRQYTLCVGEYQQAVKLRPQSAIIYLKMARCYRKADQLDVAVAMLNRASVQESGLADIYKELGAIYEIKGEVLKAIEAYRQYFVLNPNAADRRMIEQRILNLQNRGSR